MHVLDLASEGFFKGLKILDLSSTEDDDAPSPHWEDDNEDGEDECSHLVLMDETVGHLVTALRSGGLSGLEELNLRSCVLDIYSFRNILRCLIRKGAFPHLRRLNLASLHCGGDSIQLLAEALATGRLSLIHELELSGNDLRVRVHGGGVELARALQGGACPELVKLRLENCRLCPQVGQALGEAMRSGACTNLEELDLCGNKTLGDEGFMAIFGALEAGGCPSLTRLNMDSASMAVESATALGHALRSGHCSRLSHLSLDLAFHDREASLALLRAFQPAEGGGGGGGLTLPHLLHLHVARNGMDQEHGQLLGDVIARGALQELEELGLRSWGGDGFVVPILMAIEGGGCRHLKKLDLSSMKMGPQGGQALARALASGHLACLQDLSASGNPNIGDEVMAALIAGLRQCPDMRHLGMYDTGMGVMAGQALLQALQDKAWPKIEGLSARTGNELMWRDEGVMWGLVEVLEGRSILCPRLKGQDFIRSQDVEEGEGEGGDCDRLSKVYHEMQGESIFSFYEKFRKYRHLATYE